MRRVVVFSQTGPYLHLCRKETYGTATNIPKGTKRDLKNCLPTKVKTKHSNCRYQSYELILKSVRFGGREERAYSNLSLNGWMEQIQRLPPHSKTPKTKLQLLHSTFSLNLQDNTIPATPTTQLTRTTQTSAIAVCNININKRNSFILHWLASISK